jgi:hypothetical protein
MGMIRRQQSEAKKAKRVSASANLVLPDRKRAVLVSEARSRRVGGTWSELMSTRAIGPTICPLYQNIRVG